MSVCIIAPLIASSRAILSAISSPLRSLLLTALLLGVAAPTVAEDNPYLDAMQAIADGRYEDARRSLASLAAQEPEHAGAWLDLAILQCGLGHREEAEALFTAIELRFAPPPAIREMIAQQRATGCRPNAGKGSYRLRTGRGYDSNANQGASNPNLSIGSGSNTLTLVLAPEYAPRGDGFTSLQAEGAVPLGNNGSLGFAHFLHRRYDTLSRYDLSSASIGLERPWQLGSWSLRATASAGLLGLGGKLYQHHLLAQVQVTPPLPLPAPWQLSLIGATSLQAYPTQSQFDALQNEFRLQLTHRGQEHLLQAGAGVLADDSSKARPGGNRQGWTASLGGRLQLGHGWSAEGAWSVLDWRGARPFSPGLIDFRREQQTRQLRLGLHYALGHGQAIIAEYRQIDNNENISIMGYRGRQFSLNWQWQP